MNDEMPPEIWVRRDDTALGPFEVSGVEDPAGLAEIEADWHRYVLVTENARLREALAAMRSMVLSGEPYSAQMRAMVEAALSRKEVSP